MPETSVSPEVAHFLKMTVFGELHCVVLLTLSVYAQQGLRYLSLCVSVKSHLTSGASVRPENTVTYSEGNGGQKKIVGVFSETTPLQSYTK